MNPFQAQYPLSPKKFQKKMIPSVVFFFIIVGAGFLFIPDLMINLGLLGVCAVNILVYSWFWKAYIRNYFYVYSYAYGQLISKALYRKYKENPEFIFQIEKFLKAGGSKSPVDIFKEIDIDTSKPDFFLVGIKQIEYDIKSLEKAAKEAKLI